MNRYAETFFHYWLLCLIPLIALPVGYFSIARHQPKIVLTTAKMWVDSSIGGGLGTGAYYNPWVSPAQNEVDALNQLLQISSFDSAVAQGSPLYKQMLSRMPNSGSYLAVDLTKNVQFSAVGDNLVNVTYSSLDWQLGVEVVQSLVNAARNQTQVLNQQQINANIAYYRYQLHSAQQTLAQSSKRLSDYMIAQNISPAELVVQETGDPKLASLHQVVLSDQQAAQAAQQQVTKLVAQSQVPTALAANSAFRLADPPRVVVTSNKKKELMNIALYFAIGLVLSGGFVVIKTLLDRSIRFANEVPDLVDLPVLAVLPYSTALAMPRQASAPAASSSSKGPAGSRRIG